MENILIDLKIKVENLEVENKALKRKMEQMYVNWNYDYKRFKKLKEFLKEKNITVDIS